MTERHTTRGRVAKAMIGLAVLTPAALLVGVFILRSRGASMAFDRGRVQTLFVLDAVLLVAGLLLHRGEEL